MAANYWSEFPKELLELILKRLPFVDIVRFKAVCSSWNTAAQSYIASPFYIPPCYSPPLMMLSDKQDGDDHPGRAIRFFSVTENKYYKTESSNIEEFQSHYYCLASSDGWLMVSSRGSKSYSLLNPFSGVKIQLPYHRQLWTCRAHQSALVFFDQYSPSKSFCVVAVARALVFWIHGDDAWTRFGDRLREYSNLTCHNGLLYALSCANTLEAWNFHSGLPAKVLDLNLARAINLKDTTSYLMESMGELLLATQIIGGPGFAVYKMDFGRKRWVFMENLLDRALFLCGKGSFSVSSRDFPEVGESLIYYINAYREFGVYNYKEKKLVKKIDREISKSRKARFWVVPNP